MTEKLPNPKDLRIELGLNQEQFWERLGVTQSGGSRYESGRSMPKPVKKLMSYVYVAGIDPNEFTPEDANILRYLKSQQPELYASLKQAAHVLAHSEDVPA
ncbi:helix-turn-helix domain-containing protein [Chitinibacteraceae bacterium HSL-7]